MESWRARDFTRFMGKHKTKVLCAESGRSITAVCIHGVDVIRVRFPAPRLCSIATFPCNPGSLAARPIDEKVFILNTRTQRNTEGAMSCHARVQPYAGHDTASTTRLKERRTALETTSALCAPGTIFDAPASAAPFHTPFPEQLLKAAEAGQKRSRSILELLGL